jgi:hypothetical protein
MSVLHRLGVAAGIGALSLGLAASPAQAEDPPPQPTADLQALIDYYDCVPYMHGNNINGWLRQVTFLPQDPEETWIHVEAVGERQWNDTHDCKR